MKRARDMLRRAALALARALALALALAAPAAAGPAPAWNVSCCRAFEALAAMAVERSGSSLPADACRAAGARCGDLKLVREFVEQSRAVLGRDGVQMEAGTLRLTLPEDAEAALGLLAWAFLGRVVALPSAGAASQQKVLLEYEIHSNSLRVKRDACEFDKGVHSAMVLASVALLVFFISMTVVERARPSTTPTRALAAVTVGTQGVCPAYRAHAGALFEAVPANARARLPWSADGL
jgi:hypothetical protein